MSKPRTRAELNEMIAKLQLRRRKLEQAQEALGKIVPLPSEAVFDAVQNEIDRIGGDIAFLMVERDGGQGK